MIFIKKIIHTAIRQIGKTFRLTQHIPGHHNRDKRLPIHTTNSNAIRIVVNNLYGHSSESNHYLPPFASSLIMHVLTNAEKLIPRRDAASLAESRKLAGIRIVTGTTSPFTRYERISVSSASCSIRSEYVIAFYTFKLQYKCNNSTPAWEQRKLIMVAPLQRGFDLPAEKIIPGVYPVMMSNGIGAYHNEYKVKGPGVVTGRSGTIGNLQYVESAFWPHNTTLWVTKFYGNHPKFIYYLYEKIDLKRYKAGSGVPTLNRNDVHDTMVFFPASRKEQELISAVLTYLDDLITLHQRKRLSIRQRSPVWS